MSRFFCLLSPTRWLFGCVVCEHAAQLFDDLACRGTEKTLSSLHELNVYRGADAWHVEADQAAACELVAHAALWQERDTEADLDQALLGRQTVDRHHLRRT